MRVLLASLVTASVLWGVTPAMALTPLDDSEIELQEEAQGWLNATCTYYDLGWISEEQASSALRRLMVLIKGDYLGGNAWRQTTQAALERDPGCHSIWPEIGE